MVQATGEIESDLIPPAPWGVSVGAALKFSFVFSGLCGKLEQWDGGIWV
jgi:hypothetical protein